MHRQSDRSTSPSLASDFSVHTRGYGRREGYSAARDRGLEGVRRISWCGITDKGKAHDGASTFFVKGAWLRIVLFGIVVSSVVGPEDCGDA